MTAHRTAQTAAIALETIPRRSSVIGLLVPCARGKRTTTGESSATSAAGGSAAR